MIIAVVATVCAWLFVPESPVRTPGRISWLAAVLLSAWLVALLLGVSEAPSWGWGSPRVHRAHRPGRVVLAVAWVWVELRAAEPLVDMHMMRRRAVWTNNLVAFMFGIGMYSVIGFLPEFVQTPTSTGYGFGASIIQSGLFLLPLTVTMFIVGLLSRADRRHHRLARRRSSSGRLPRSARLPAPGLRPPAGVGDLPGQHAAGRRASGLAFSAMSEPHRPGRARRPRPGWPAA